jgi:HK97 family phage prohead protease
VSDFTRSFPMEASVRSGGDGRTVDAYAAVFGVPVPISDREGQYREQIDPAAFNKTLADKGTRFGVLYNHGMTLYGTPSDRGSMPIGTPLEVRVDTRGLYTVTRYNNTPLADEALEGIKSGALRSQSFQGRFIRSDRRTPRGGFRANADGSLPLITRQEVDLKEYGPSPFAAYTDAVIVGWRAGLTLTDSDTLLLQLILSNLAEGDAALDPIVDALTKTDDALDQAQMVLAQILGVPNPDPPDAEDMMADDRSVYLSRLNCLATRLATAPARTTTPPGAGADEPLTHSGRLSLSQRSRHILAALHQE